MTENIYMDVIHDSICCDIKKAYTSGVFAGAVILTLSAIDAMAFLSMPLDTKEVHRKDYIAWINKYMKTDPSQSYQYNGVDIYGARCGIVHRYGVRSRLSESGQCKIFAYHTNPDHIYNPEKNNNMVIISIKRLTNDFYRAVGRFLEDILQDKDLKARADSRITSLFRLVSKENLKKKYG